MVLGLRPPHVVVIMCRFVGQRPLRAKERRSSPGAQANGFSDGRHAGIHLRTRPRMAKTEGSPSSTRPGSRWTGPVERPRARPDRQGEGRKTQPRIRSDVSDPQRVAAVPAAFRGMGIAGSSGDRPRSRFRSRIRIRAPRAGRQVGIPGLVPGLHSRRPVSQGPSPDPDRSGDPCRSSLKYRSESEPTGDRRPTSIASISHRPTADDRIKRLPASTAGLPEPRVQPRASPPMRVRRRPIDQATTFRLTKDDHQ